MADVEGLSEVCARADALLVLDDAHAVFGEGAPACRDTACLRVGTLSKALGSQGGYVAGPRSWIDLLINRARSFIFTTGLSAGECRGSPSRSGDLPVIRGGCPASHPATPHRHRPPRSWHADHPDHDWRRDRRRWTPPTVCCSAGCWSPPSARPRCRPAPAGCGCPCPPPTPRPTSPGWSKRSKSWREAAPGGGDQRYRNRGGQDVHRRPTPPRAGRSGAIRGGPQTGPVLLAREMRPTARSSLGRRANQPSVVCPAHRSYPLRHGPADGG